MANGLKFSRGRIDWYHKVTKDKPLPRPWHPKVCPQHCAFGTFMIPKINQAHYLTQAQVYKLSADFAYYAHERSL